MNQMTNGRGSMGRPGGDMRMQGGSAWGNTVDQWSSGQSATDMFAGMPGSMNYQTPGNMGNISAEMNNMNGNMPSGGMDPGMHTTPPGAGMMQMLDLDTGLSQDALENPTTLLEARLGSLRALLSKLVGHYVVVTYLMGTETPVAWEGFLYNVGNDYIVLFQPDMGRYITGDMYSIKFVEFYEEKGVIPPCIGYRRRDSHGTW